MQGAFVGVQVAADGLTHHVAGVTLRSDGQHDVTVWQGQGSENAAEIITEFWPDSIKAVAIDPWFGSGLAERIGSRLPTRILRVIANGNPIGTEAGAVALAQSIASELGGMQCSDGSPGVVLPFVSAS